MLTFFHLASSLTECRKCINEVTDMRYKRPLARKFIKNEGVNMAFQKLAFEKTHGNFKYTPSQVCQKVKRCPNEPKQKLLAATNDCERCITLFTLIFETTRNEITIPATLEYGMNICEQTPVGTAGLCENLQGRHVEKILEYIKTTIYQDSYLQMCADSGLC